MHIRFQSIILYEWIISVHYFRKDLVRSPFRWIYLSHIFVYCPFLDLYTPPCLAQGSIYVLFLFWMSCLICQDFFWNFTKLSCPSQCQLTRLDNGHGAHRVSWLICVQQSSCVTHLEEFDRSLWLRYRHPFYLNLG